MSTTVALHAAGTPRRSSLAEVWEYRELLRMLTLRNLKVKYKRSVLGFVWTLLNPLLTVATLVAVFTHVIRLDIPDYWAFLLSGFFAWNVVLLVLGSGTAVLPEHAAMLRSVPVPGQVFVLAAVASRMVEFVVELGLCLVLLAIFHHQGIPASFVLLPVLLIAQLLMVTGLVLPIATLAAFYDDVAHVLPVVLLLLFYASPVFYPASMVPESVRGFYFLNPIAGLLTTYHKVLYEGRFPDLELLGVVSAVAVGTCLFGFAVFNRYKRIFPEIL